MAKRRPQRIHGSGGGIQRSGSADYGTRKTEGVVIAYPHRLDAVNARFHTCLVKLLAFDVLGGIVDGKKTGGHGRVIGHGGHLPLSSGANIVSARNKLVKQYLEEAPAEWLLFLDDDMTFEPDLIERMLASTKWSAREEKAQAGSGHKVGDLVRPVLGALCFALTQGEGQNIIPTIYGSAQGQQMIRYNGYPQDTIVQVIGTGAACLLIHRSVLEAMRDKRWDEEMEAAYREQSGGIPSSRPLGSLVYPPPWPWFAETITGANWGDSISEDLTFCLRAAQCGFPIHIDTSIKTGHVKPVVIDEDAYFNALPPAEDSAPTFVVVPVKGQQQYTDALVAQLVGQGGYDDVFIYDNADQPEDEWGTGREEVLAQDHVHRIVAPGKTIYEMWNMGIREALSRAPRCNIFIVNNDVVIGEDLLKRLADGLRAHPAIAAVSPNYDGRQFGEQVQAVKGIAAGREDGTGGLAGFAFMVRGEVFVAGCPMFNEDYRLWYADTEFVMQLDKVDATYGIVRDTSLVHIDGGSKTTGDGEGHRLRPEYRDVVAKDAELFDRRWGQDGECI